MNQKISIAICILFFEKADQTIECVESFAPSGVPIYILNNNSSEESTDKLKNYCANMPQVKIFDSPENLGVSGGRNFLIKNTTEDWMFFVDNDITIKTQPWLEIVANLILENPDTEAFIPRLYNLYENNYAERSSFIIKNRMLLKENKTDTKAVNCFSGGASVVSRKLFDRLGLYSEEMFVGFEDYEMALRGMTNGNPIRAMLIDSIELIHDHRIASNANDKNSARVRYDLEKHKISERYIKNKYGISVEPSWSYWVKNQEKLLAYGEQIKPLNVLQKIYFKILRSFGRFF